MTTLMIIFEALMAIALGVMTVLLVTWIVTGALILCFLIRDWIEERKETKLELRLDK